jgi:hypothetical protein
MSVRARIAIDSSFNILRRSNVNGDSFRQQEGRENNHLWKQKASDRVGTVFFLINPTDALVFKFIFCQETLQVSGSSSAHHQEFSTVHSAVVYVMHVWWHIPVPNVQWKTPDVGQRNCLKRVEFLTKMNLEISASVGFIKKKFVTMHGHMNLKTKVGAVWDKLWNISDTAEWEAGRQCDEPAVDTVVTWRP